MIRSCDCVFHILLFLSAYKTVSGVFHLLLFLSAYKTVSGVNGPLVILDDVKVQLTDVTQK